MLFSFPFSPVVVRAGLFLLFVVAYRCANNIYYLVYLFLLLTSICIHSFRGLIPFSLLPNDWATTLWYARAIYPMVRTGGALQVAKKNRVALYPVCWGSEFGGCLVLFCCHIGCATTVWVVRGIPPWPVGIGYLRVRPVDFTLGWFWSGSWVLSEDWSGT